MQNGITPNKRQKAFAVAVILNQNPVFLYIVGFV